MNIVITGASRGLGLEFARQWLAAGHQVAALARRPEESRGLQALAGDYAGSMLVAACDVTDDASVLAACQSVAARWNHIDLLVNNAGVMGARGSFPTLELDRIRITFDVNVLGPLRVTRAFLPLLRAGTEPKLVLMTSKMGSIEDNTSGGAWGYRISKSALNMVGRNLMHELASTPIRVVLMHPGWVATDMGGETAPLSPEESIRSMIETLDGLGPEDSGVFVDYSGARVPW